MIEEDEGVFILPFSFPFFLCKWREKKVVGMCR